MNKLGVIAKSTYRKNIRSWGFWGMILSPLIMIAIVAAISYFSGNKADEMSSGKIAVLDSDVPIEQVLKGSSIEIDKDLKTEKEAEKALKDDDIQGIVSVKQKNDGTLDISVTEYGSFYRIQQQFEGIMTGLQSNIYASHLNLPPDQLAQLFKPAKVDYQKFQADSDSKDNGVDFVQMGFAYVICVFTLMLVVFYGQTIVNEIASDKGTRMMEVILSSTSASSHFFGKILGLVGLMVTQLAIYAVAGVGAYYYFYDHKYAKMFREIVSSSDDLLSTIIYSFVFFLLASALYILFSAFIGSLVNKTEDAAKAMTPLSMLLMIGFYGGIFGMMDAENIFLRVMSHIPFFSPFIMPFRMAGHTVELPEVWLSIGINVAFVILATYLVVTMYKSNVLIYSDSNLFKKLKQSWKMSHE